MSDHLRARIAELEASLEASRRLVVEADNRAVVARAQRDEYKMSYEILYRHSRELEVAIGDLRDTASEKISNLEAVVDIARELLNWYVPADNTVRVEDIAKLEAQLKLNDLFGETITGAATCQSLLEDVLRLEKVIETKDENYATLFNELARQISELIDKDRDIDSLRTRLAFYEDACERIVKLVQSHENKPIKAKKFILQLYQLAVSALSIHPPDGKSETTRIVKTEP